MQTKPIYLKFLKLLCSNKLLGNNKQMWLFLKYLLYRPNLRFKYLKSLLFLNFNNRQFLRQLICLRFLMLFLNNQFNLKFKFLYSLRFKCLEFLRFLFNQFSKIFLLSLITTHQIISQRKIWTQSLMFTKIIIDCQIPWYLMAQLLNKTQLS